MREIFKTKEQLLADYRRLYFPVQAFIDQHEVSQQQGALQFSASITVDGFGDRLLDMIHQGRRGRFQGEQDGQERIREILANGDFSTETGVQAFLMNIQDHLGHDKRERETTSQLVPATNCAKARLLMTSTTSYTASAI